jgi:hypothetical protein
VLLNICRNLFAQYFICFVAIKKEYGTDDELVGELIELNGAHLLSIKLPGFMFDPEN